MAVTPSVTNPSGTYTQDPLLFPNMSSPVMLGTAVANPGGAAVGVVPIQLQSAAQFKADFSAVNATATLTLGGTVASGDVVGVTFSAPLLPGGTHSTTVTAATGDTPTTVALKLADAIAEDTVLQPYGVEAAATAGAMVFSWHSPDGNNVTVLGTKTGAETWTPSTATALASGRGVVTPKQSFVFAIGGAVGGPAQLMQFTAGRPVVVDAHVAAALEAAGMPID